MNAKVLYILLGLLATCLSFTVALSEQMSDGSGSLTPAEAAIPLCSQIELVTVGSIMKTDVRKVQCQTTLRVTEVLTATDKKAVCLTTSCTAALSSLLRKLPNCRYQNWAIRYHVERLMMFCGIDPAKVAAGSGSSDQGTAGVSSGTNATTASPNWNVSASSSSGNFAPIGTTPAPTQASVTQVPSPTKSAAVGYSVSVATILSLLGLVAL